MNMITIERIILLYLIIVNAAGFLLMLVDKYKAKKKAWRIPEATLFLFAIFGGSLGSTLGMFAFRHKTRHWYFTVINVLGTLAQLGALGYIFFTFV